MRCGRSCRERKGGREVEKERDRKVEAEKVEEGERKDERHLTRYESIGRKDRMRL
jgi:hypothetical protein